VLIDDWFDSDDYRQHIATQKAHKEQLIEIYSRRYEQRLGIFTGKPLPPGENPELGESE